MIERNGLRVEQRVFCYLGCDWIICDALTKLMKGQVNWKVTMGVWQRLSDGGTGD